MSSLTNPRVNKTLVCDRETFNRLAIKIAVQVAKRENQVKRDTYNQSNPNNFFLGVSCVIEMLWLLYHATATEKVKLSFEQSSRKEEFLHRILGSLVLENKQHPLLNHRVSVIGLISLSDQGELNPIFIENTKAVNQFHYRIPITTQRFKSHSNFNRWVSEVMDLTKRKLTKHLKATDQQVWKIITENDFNNFQRFSSGLMMISHSYFDGRWATNFHSYTHLGDFYVFEQVTRKIEMITFEPKYLRVSKIELEWPSTIISLPYQNNYQLVICMPKKVATFNDLVTQLATMAANPKMFEDIITSFERQKCTELIMPRFLGESHRHNLNVALKTVDELLPLVSNESRLPHLFVNHNLLFRDVELLNVASIIQDEEGTRTEPWKEICVHMPLVPNWMGKSYFQSVLRENKSSGKYYFETVLQKYDPARMYYINKPFMFFIVASSIHIIDVGFFLGGGVRVK